MWWILVAVLLSSLWLFGMLTAFTLSGFIHVLLVLALVSLIIQLLKGRRAT
jgi:hypothetical protein